MNLSYSNLFVVGTLTFETLLRHLPDHEKKARPGKRSIKISIFGWPTLNEIFLIYTYTSSLDTMVLGT